MPSIVAGSVSVAQSQMFLLPIFLLDFLKLNDILNVTHRVSWLFQMIKISKDIKTKRSLCNILNKLPVSNALDPMTFPTPSMAAMSVFE